MNSFQPRNGGTRCEGSNLVVCELCEHYVRLGFGLTGECRGSTPFAIDENGLAVWPQVRASDFCAKFKENPNYREVQEMTHVRSA